MCSGDGRAGGVLSGCVQPHATAWGHPASLEVLFKRGAEHDLIFLRVVLSLLCHAIPSERERRLPGSFCVGRQKVSRRQPAKPPFRSHFAAGTDLEK